MRPSRPPASVTYRTPSITSEAFGYFRELARGLARYDATLHEPLQTLVERLHAGRCARLNRRIHLRHFAFANQVTNGGGRDHDFVRGDAAAVHALQQRLRDDGLQR